jgi:2Fe-2S ferredoxin
MITILNLSDKVIAVNHQLSLLKNIHLAGVDWMYACGGKGRCTTCRAKVISGIENLSERSVYETRFLAQGRLAPDERLMCQTQLLHQSISIMVPDDCKLPHLFYS